MLVVSPTFPFPPISGFNMRCSQLTRQLARRHDVTFLAYISPDDAPLNAPEVTELTESIRVRAVTRGPESRVTKRFAQLKSLASSHPYVCQSMQSREMQEAITNCMRCIILT